MNKEHKFFSSSIVPGHIPIALGVALALKRKNSGNHVWVFCGDMAAETGVFHEASKFAIGHELPITFVVEDDALSVYTPTKQVWKATAFNQEDSSLKIYSLGKNSVTNETQNPKILRYKYEREWPHHGIGLWVEFPEDNTSEKQMASYKVEIKKAMSLLGNDERTVFIGQTVGFKGSAVFESVSHIPEEKRVELPIMEEIQMGISTGLALEGFVPVSIYPRIDFMILATNQLVNHLDKIYELSSGQFNPKVIIRTMIGSKDPLFPGVQHCQDHTQALRLMLTNINVEYLDRITEIVPKYEKALNGIRSSLFIEPPYLRGE